MEIEGKIAEILNNPMYVTAVMAVIAFLTVLLLYFLMGRKKKSIRQKVNKSKAIVEEDVNKEEAKEYCLVVDENTRSFDVEEITVTELEKVKNANPDGIGRQWNYEKYELYYLFRNKKGDLSPVNVPQTLDTPPSLLYEALSQEDTEIIFDVRKEEGAFAKYGPYLIVAGIAAFVIIATMQQGG